MPLTSLTAASAPDKPSAASPGELNAVSSFEMLLRATPGSRRVSATVDAKDAKGVTKSHGSLALSDVSDLPAKEVNDSASFPPRRVAKDADDSSVSLLFLDGSAIAPSPWPAQAPVLVQSFGQHAIDEGLALALNSPEPGPTSQPQLLIEPGVAEARQGASTPAWLPMSKSDGLAAELAPASPALAPASSALAPTSPALEILPSFSMVVDANPTSARDLPLQALASDRAVAPGGSAATSPSGGTVAGVGVQKIHASTSSVALSDATSPLANLKASKPGMAPQLGHPTLWRPEEVKSPLRLSTAAEISQSPAVTLAEFGAVSVRMISGDAQRERLTPSVKEARQGADGLGSWVPELGGILTAGEAVNESAAFAQQLAEKVDAWVGQSLQVAEIRLQEPNTDPVLVRIEMNGQQANVMFRTDIAACRDALVGQMDHLSELLSAQGLQLGGASVGGSGADSSKRQNASADGVGWPSLKRTSVEPLSAIEKPARRPLNSAGRALDIFV